MTEGLYQAVRASASAQLPQRRSAPTRVQVWPLQQSAVVPQLAPIGTQQRRLTGSQVGASGPASLVKAQQLSWEPSQLVVKSRH